MDTLGNLLTSLRNAQMARHTEAHVQNTKLNRAVLAVLEQGKFVGAVEAPAEGAPKITVRFASPVVVRHMKRVSKPGRRIYTDAKSIPTVRQGLGTVIISTNEGVISGQEARKRKLGGEILCEVY